MANSHFRQAAPLVLRRPSVAARLGTVAIRDRHPLSWAAGLPHKLLTGWLKCANYSEIAPPVVADHPLRRADSEARLEAVFFLAREPLPSRKLAQLAHLSDGTQTRTLIRHLNKLYDQAGCAFRIEEVAGGFQMLTRPMFGPWLRRLLPLPVETRLSAPSLETLAVVAYRQPVTRADIEAVRGVQCGEILRQLMERDLVRIAGRADDLGRPFLYGTTKRFLQIFGLKHLDELPRYAILCTLKQSAGSPPTASPAVDVLNNSPAPDELGDRTQTPTNSG